MRGSKWRKRYDLRSSQTLKGSPIKPLLHVQVALCRFTEHCALTPHARVVQGSKHSSLMHARWSGHSGSVLHSGWGAEISHDNLKSTNCWNISKHQTHVVYNLLLVIQCIHLDMCKWVYDWQLCNWQLQHKGLLWRRDWYMLYFHMQNDLDNHYLLNSQQQEVHQLSGQLSNK